MKHLLKVSAILILLALAAGIFTKTYNVCAQETPTDSSAHIKTLNIYFFHSNVCPHCIKEIEFLQKIAPKYPNVTISTYEITTNSHNLQLFINVGTKLGETSGGIPFLVVGNESLVGFNDASTTGAEIESKINEALKNPPQDVVKETIEETNITPKAELVTGKELRPNKGTSGTPQGTTLKVPIFGTINLKTLSLPVLTAVLGFLDGFNPCSMWVLLFLLSLIIGMNDRKKMWLLGGTFILISGIIYYLFMAAWLNAFLLLGYITLIRYFIGILSLGMGIYYLRDYWKNRKGGCEVVGEEKRQKIFDKIRAIVHKQSLWLALVGIATLAVAVNSFELLCSAGLPALYTKVLSMTPMPHWNYYTYLLLYIFFYLLDNLVIFFAAVITFETIGIKNKYVQYSRLVGGVLILVIGLLMLFNPGVLMFG